MQKNISNDSEHLGPRKVSVIEMVSFIWRVLYQRSHCVSLPGRNPGTSSKVMRGILKASQNLTNLAPLMDGVISRHPIGGGGGEEGGGRRVMDP